MYYKFITINSTFINILVAICDWASEKGSSGHIKFGHLFQLCCIITKDIFNFIFIFLFLWLYNADRPD